MRDARGASKKGHLLDWVASLVTAHGTTFSRTLFWQRDLTTIEPANIEAVLSTQFRNFSLGRRRAATFPLLGDGIFTQDGPAWKHSREMLRPQFAKNEGGVGRTVELLNRHVDCLLGVLPKGQAVDLQSLFFDLTLDTTTEFLFGRSVDALIKPETSDDDHDDGSSQFGEAFMLGQETLAKRMRAGNLYWLYRSKEFGNSCEQVHDFVDGIVAKALAARQARLVDGNSGLEDRKSYVFLEALIEETQDPIVLRSQCLHILIAGRDTTACTLSWAFRLLARSPSTWKRLREEVMTSVGSEKRPGKDDLKNLPFLNIVLKETLRLYPAVPLNARVCVNTTVLPRGGGKDGLSPILIREGESLGYSVYHMQRREDIYGPDAHIFRPERWETDLNDGEESLAKRVGWAYVPFNGGPRRCLGEEFALMEAGITIVRIAQKFAKLSAVNAETKQILEIEESLATGDERQATTLVLACAEACWVELA